MEPNLVAARIAKILKAIESLIPEYLADPLDLQISQGNVAVCIIDAQGNVYGKLFAGNGDRLRQRESYRVAWMKASQVWITGVETFEYEKLVFTGQIDAKQFGITHPDFIWMGGRTATLPGFGHSNFRWLQRLSWHHGPGNCPTRPETDSRVIRQ